MAKGMKRKSGIRPGRKHDEQVASRAGEPLIDRVAGVYISTIAFLTGASVMIVELAASRVLSPYFGNTLYTWTALIGVIMIALSAGYYAGGRLADRRPTLVTLLHLVSIAAAFVILVPVLALKVAASLAPEGHPPDILWGPLVAALLLFAVPGILLGSVSPFAIKLLSLRSENARVGTSAGTVSGLSTAGSVLGTFGAGFVLIPSLGIRTIFIVVGVVLLLVAALGYAGLMGSRHRSIPAAVLVLIAGVFLAAVAESSEDPREPNVVFRTDTFYHRIDVERFEVANGQTVTQILMDRAPEGAQLENGGDLVYDYTHYYQLERIFVPNLRRAAFLGGGAYSMPEALANDHPGAAIDVVEIDPMVERLGRRFYYLDEYRGRVRPVVGDGRMFLLGARQRYDLIFGDAYRGQQNVPSHMITREFFELTKRRLNDDGVFMMNLISAVNGPMSKLFASVSATLLEVYPELYVFAIDAPFPTRPQNLILVAPARRRGYDENALAERAGDDEDTRLMIQNFVPSAFRGTSGATVLTDDHNPVEYIIARQLKQLRRSGY
jgi:spermidine synthase